VELSEPPLFEKARGKFTEGSLLFPCAFSLFMVCFDQQVKYYEGE
jgi:hypothetical protein